MAVLSAPPILDSTAQDMVTALNLIATKTVDSALSDTSINPVQNKVVKAAIDGKQASLTWDGNYINL